MGVSGMDSSSDVFGCSRRLGCCCCGCVWEEGVVVFEGAGEGDLMDVGAGDRNCINRWEEGEVGEESSKEGEKRSGDCKPGDGNCGAPCAVLL
jgi:hypothetical protein